MKQKSQKQLLIDFMKAGNRVNKIIALQNFNIHSNVLCARMKEIHKMSDYDLLEGFVYQDRAVPEHHYATEYWLLAPKEEKKQAVIIPEIEEANILEEYWLTPKQQELFT